MSPHARPAADLLDAALLRQIIDRDQTAIARLYDVHVTTVFSLALRICRNSALAEEATQDAFFQVWRDAGRYEPDRASVRAWILAIARGRALDRLRGHNTRIARAAEGGYPTELIPDSHAGPETGTMERQQAAEVQSVLDFLSADERRLIELAYMEGLTYSEMAAALDRPLGTVKTQMRRVLKLLRTALIEPRRPFAWSPWSEAAQDRATGGRTLEDLQVLVVDDDPDTLQLIAFVLHRAGAHVMTAASASQAMRKIATVWPDLLVSDLDMPVEDGFSLLQRVRLLAARDDRPIPAVAFSAYSGASDRERSAAVGFSHHLPKPVRPSLLIERIAELVRCGLPSPELFTDRAVPGAPSTVSS